MRTHCKPKFMIRLVLAFPDLGNLLSCRGWSRRSEHCHAAHGQGVEMCSRYPLGPNLPILSRLAASRQGLLLLPALPGLEYGVVVGIYVDGNLGFGQLAARFHHRPFEQLR